MDADKTEFPVWLFSNASTDVYKDNKCSQFKNHLAKPLDLKGNWEVALHSISYPNNFKNIKKPCKFTITFTVNNTADDERKSESLEVIIKDGYYKTIAEIQEAIEQGIKKQLDKWVKENKGAWEISTSLIYLSRISGKVSAQSPPFQFPRLVYSAEKKEFTLETSDFKEFQIDKFEGFYIWRALGYEPGLEKIDKTSKIKYKPSLTLNFPSHFIYSSIVEASSVGNSTVPLIAQVPEKGELDHYSFQEFTKPVFVKVVQNYISDIDIKIVDILGEESSFSDGVVSVVLLFKRRS